MWITYLIRFLRVVFFSGDSLLDNLFRDCDYFAEQFCKISKSLWFSIFHTYNPFP